MGRLTLAIELQFYKCDARPNHRRDNESVHGGQKRNGGGYNWDIRGHHRFL